MYNKNNRHAQSITEPMAFQFSATKQEMQTLLIKENPWIVAKDVCDILGLNNPTRALSGLDEDEKLTLPIVRAGQTRKTNLVNESGLYALIFKSRKPEAKAFRKWVTSEVLPAIRKRGYYYSHTAKVDYIDARDIVPSYLNLNDYMVTTIQIEENKAWYNINDIHRAIRATTGANQTAKKLNAKQQLAVKIHVYGGTHPSWFTNQKGMQLIIQGSRNLKQSNQLNLPL